MTDSEDPVALRAKWFWAVLLVLAIALVAWFLNLDPGNDDMVPADVPVTMQEPLPDPSTPDAGPAADTGAVMLGQVERMVGRIVELPDVAVNRVVGDEAFTIGTGTAETLVMFDETRTPAMAREGMKDISPGSRVTVTGTVRSLDGMELPDSISNDLATGEQVYIAAGDVAMMD